MIGSLDVSSRADTSTDSPPDRRSADTAQARRSWGRWPGWMHRPRSLLGSTVSVRPGVRVLVVLALLALIGLRVFGYSGGTTELTNAELAHLPVQLNSSQPRPAIQSAAFSCFRTAPAVTSVRSDGRDLALHFAGVGQQMKIEFLADENAAIRATNTNPNEAGNFYNNTIWLQTPSHLGRADIDALGRCIPDGTHHHQQRRGDPDGSPHARRARR